MAHLKRIPASQIKRGPRRLEQLPPELITRIKALWGWERPYFGGSLKDFVQSFMHETHPEREVGIAEAIGAGMAEVEELPWPQRKAVYRFLLLHSLGQPTEEIAGPLVDAFPAGDAFIEITDRVRVAYESKWVELEL